MPNSTHMALVYTSLTIAIPESQPFLPIPNPEIVKCPNRWTLLLWQTVR